MKTDAGDLPEEVEEMPDCDICKGVGWVYLNVQVGHELFGRAVRCSCCLEKDWQARAARMLKYCQLPIGSENYTFEKYDRKLGSKEAYEAALDVATGELLWLVLNGGRDRGKTHLSIAICRYWLALGKVARYVHVPLLLDELREGFDGELLLPLLSTPTLKEMGYKSQFDVNETAWDCWLRIKAVKTD